MRFDGAEVLHIPADTAAGVLPKSIHQGREVNGIAGGPPIVIAIRVHRGPVAIDAAIGIQGESEERRGPVPPGEHPSQGAFVDESAGQIRGVLAAPGRALDRFGWRVEGGESAADSGGAQCGVEFGH